MKFKLDIHFSKFQNGIIPTVPACQNGIPVFKSVCIPVFVNHAIFNAFLTAPQKLIAF